jgi:hypothetical protein
MIQFNLLPDIKLEYIRAQRTKRLMMTVSVLVATASLAFLVILIMTVFVFQKQHMSHLSKDITDYGNDLKATPDLDKVLTVQNQLNSLTGIHEQKPEVNRIIPYIQQVTPSSANISSLKVDFSTNAMTITGNADSLEIVNKYVDTLKFTHYNDGASSPEAFSNVVLTTFGRADKGASFTIDLVFDPVIFNNTKTITLTVPKIISTRSNTEKPKVLFETTTTEKEQ